MVDDEKEPDLKQVADAARASVAKAAMESVKAIQERNRKENLEKYGCDCPAAKCYATCPRAKSAEDFMRWWRSNSPPPRNEKEVLPPGEPSRKGGSKSKRKRKKKPTFKNLYIEC